MDGWLLNGFNYDLLCPSCGSTFLWNQGHDLSFRKCQNCGSYALCTNSDGSDRNASCSCGYVAPNQNFKHKCGTCGGTGIIKQCEHGYNSSHNYCNHNLLGKKHE